MSTQPCGHPLISDEERLGHAEQEVLRWKFAERTLNAQASQHKDRCEYYAFRADVTGVPVVYSTLVEAHSAAETMFRQFADEAATEATDWKVAVVEIKKQIKRDAAASVDAVAGLQSIAEDLAS